MCPSYIAANFHAVSHTPNRGGASFTFQEEDVMFIARTLAALAVVIALISCPVWGASMPVQASITVNPVDPPADPPAPPSPATSSRLGLGVSIGEYTSMGILPLPTYGVYGCYAVSPAITLGVQVGFLSGSASGDDADKEFESVTTFNIAPSAQFLFGTGKVINPVIKVAFSFLNYDITDVGTGTHPGETTSKSASSLWASAGLRCSITDNLSIMAAVRFMDIGISGDSKISAFGIMNPSASFEFMF